MKKVFVVVLIKYNNKIVISLYKLHITKKKTKQNNKISVIVDFN